MPNEVMEGSKRWHNMIGVVIGRFQSPYLHAGHQFVLDVAEARHDKVLVLLGIHGGNATRRDPLDYNTRKQMIEWRYPRAVVKPVYDMRTDEAWSVQVDGIILDELGEPAEIDGTEALLYGGRDSFLPHYFGDFKTEQVDYEDQHSGTALRNEEFGQFNESFRRGIIHAEKNRYPISYQTVDIAVFHSTEPKIALGQKFDVDRYCFPGGFVDPTDISLEAVCRREVSEELGVSIDGIEYIGSRRVPDYRYNGSEEGIMTALFVATYQFGKLEAGSDLSGAEWVPIDALQYAIQNEHVELAGMVLKHLEEKPRW